MSPALLGTTSVSIPQPLTIDGVAEWRSKAKVPLPTGVASSSNSDMFKSPACYTKPKAKRWDDFLSVESKSRKPSALKSLAKYLKQPGMISLGGGLPSSENFPFEEISAKVPTPPGFTEAETEQTGSIIRAGKHDINMEKSLYDLEVALNYGIAVGSPPLLRFVTEHTEIVHRPPYSDWHCCLTAGSTSSWDSTLRILCERGDYILTEEYSFSTALDTAAALGVRAVAVKMDEQGMLPESLDEVVAKWDERLRGARKPRVIYTIPSGQNPTGATQGVERRKAIYRVAQKHDLIIVEDEPYYFLQMQPYTAASHEPVPPPKTHEEFLKALTPSFLSLDVDGRVLRLESFSKIIAPGSRIGWVVGSEQFIERYQRHQEATTQSPSGFSQILLFKLLDEHWGHSGFFDWLIHIRVEYTTRRDSMLQACEQYLPSEIASWVPPSAGMFSWIEIDWKKHPRYSEGWTHEAIQESIFQAAAERGVLVAGGYMFKADRSMEEKRMFFRATFSAAPAGKITEAIKRFAEALKAEFQS